MANEPEKHDDDQTSTGDEISQDALGDTHLGKNLGHLIREIGRQQKQIQQAAGEAGDGTGVGDAGDPIERLNEMLEATAPGPGAPAPGEMPREGPDVSPAAPAATPAPGAANEKAGEPVLRALSEIEGVLQRFAVEERQRYEQELDAWKAQFKKAAMIVIRKQVDAARASWEKKSSENEEKVSEHYRKLKSLANKVARQKVEIQKAKQELKKKLEIADRLHIEFDGIREVLNGKLGVLDELDKTEDPPD